jgi:hypothetical protein
MREPGDHVSQADEGDPMSKFVLMFHGGETPEEPSQEVMDRWMAWFGSLGERVVDMGAPFGEAATIASDGTPSPGGGPDPATGYTVIEAASLHDAVVLAKGCPGLSSGGSVKLYEARQMG